jgi:sulfur carrier protein
MIQVNNRPMDYETHMTISDILKKKRYMDHMIVVRVNGNHVPPEAYGSKEVCDGDDVKVIHLFGGG